MCLLDKILVSDKLLSGMSAIGCEFNVSKSTRLSIQKKEEDICPSVCEATMESAKVTSMVHEKAREKMEK